MGSVVVVVDEVLEQFIGEVVEVVEGRAVDDVVSLMEDGSGDLELERLRTVIADNILTSEVKRNGIGGIDTARLERSIDQIAEDFKFQKRPAAPDVFDGSFLPPIEGRLIN